MSNETRHGPATGGCLCGAVRYRVAGGLRPTVNACHCGQCRRFHGTAGAYSSAAERDVAIEGRDKVRWYQSSAKARRAFCSVCGTKLFWQAIGSEALDISAGTFDLPSGVRLARHIYVASKGDYEVIADDLPQFPASSGG